MLSTQWGLGCWVRAPGFPETAILPLPWPCREGPRDTDPTPTPLPSPPSSSPYCPAPQTGASAPGRPPSGQPRRQSCSAAG